MRLKGVELLGELELTEKEYIGSLNDLGQKRGYSTAQNIDYGYGIIDSVWKIPLHPSLPEIRWLY